MTSWEKIELLKLSDSKELNISKNLQSILLPDITVKDQKITSKDQVKFLSLMSSFQGKKDINVNALYKKLDKLPNSIKTLVEPNMNLSKIKSIVTLLITLYVISAIFTYFEAITMTQAANRFARKLRTSISTKINKLPLKYFDQHATGDILSRVTNDIDTIAQAMNQSLSTLVSSTTLLIGTIIMMFVTNWILALTAIFSSLFGFIFMALVLGKSQKYFTARQKELGNLNGHIEEIYSGLNVVKTYNGVEESNKKFDELNKKLYEANRKSQFLSGLMPPMMQFIGNFGYVAVCIVGAVLTMNDTISFGVIIAFITYVRLFSSPLSQLAQAMTQVQTTTAASERVYEFIDEEEMDNQKSITKKLEKEEAKGNIEFKHVSFKYDGNEKPTIKDFSAIAKKGQKIAIVGPTGAGKTTMVNLLMKFYEISSGDIVIDGTSIKDLSRENIHSLFTMVLQDTWLFSGTIKENIVYNHKNISDEEIKQICETIGLNHFIKTLPNGYNTELEDNESISAGQKQLLTIARGMVEDAPFLILDEATSNVDTRTEELVQKAMDKLTEGKTSFIIAHRLSTIKNADLILVMNEGDIIEQGNHNDLIKKNGFYANLYNSQFDNELN
ncbi:MAG: ABC transporter ATP-binding protein/permease [Tenericutes bacterium]|nr:ABC transporter ATP-binding protein/permease [Mycoplasmatota bacterium]